MDQDNNQPEKSNDESAAGVGRSYECTFCKRGLTNAQALGGHMNIHRKDKEAKSKSKSKHKSTQSEAIENHPNSTYAPSPISSADHDRQQMGIGWQQNYQLFLPSPNPNFQTEYYLPVRRSDSFDAGLSLRIGRSSLTGEPDGEGEGGGGHSNVKENEVDLELRLGHDP